MTRTADGHAPDDDVRRRHRDDITGAAAVEHCTRPPRQYDAPLNPEPTLVFARCQIDDVAVLRPVEQRLQRLSRGSRQLLRNRGARNSGGEQHRRKDT